LLDHLQKGGELHFIRDQNGQIAGMRMAPKHDIPRR